MGSDIFAAEALIHPGTDRSGLSMLTVHRDFRERIMNADRRHDQGVPPARRIKAGKNQQKDSFRLSYIQAVRAYVLYFNSPGPGRDPVIAFSQAARSYFIITSDIIIACLHAVTGSYKNGRPVSYVISFEKPPFFRYSRQPGPSIASGSSDYFSPSIQFVSSQVMP